MSRIIPIHWKILECIFKKAGYVFKKQTGSHRTYGKKGMPRPVVIPTYKEIRVEVIKTNMRTANITRDTYLQFLKDCK